MKKLIILFAMLFTGLMVSAQNAYLAAVNNEDEVVHIDQQQRHAARPMQAIVKLQDYSNYTLLSKEGKKANEGRVESPAIEAVLADYIIDSVEQLCPTFVMPKDARSSASYGGGEVRDHDLSQMYLITLSPESPKNEYELMEALAALEEVEFAEPNYLVFALGEPMDESMASVADATYVSLSDKDNPKTQAKSIFLPNDPLYGTQWGIRSCNINGLLGAPKRDNNWRPIIAIIDTGVDVDHPDLAANIWTNSAEQNGATGQDDDNNGFRDDVHGWDFVNQTGDMHDFNSHGTHCAGIAGAVTGNHIGIAGACPDAWIMPVAVMQSDGTGDIATIVRGINYAAQNGADVISMSIGTYAYSTAMEQALAVAYQTAVLVGAAGNDGRKIDPRCGDIQSAPMFPGAFTFVLGIQATNQYDIASFSNIDCDGPSFSQFGEEQLYNYELSAPGVGIISTVPGGNYRAYNGTSMACPLVAGGVASLLQRREYPTKEMLFGDLINIQPQNAPNVDFWAVYNAPATAPAILQMVTFEINDTLYGDSSMYADAGERLQIYPTIRTMWGPTSNVELWLEFQQNEDQSTIQILQNHVQLGRPISAYAKAKSINPIDIQIANNVVDGRHIRLTLCASSPQANNVLRQDFTLSVTNGVKLHGMVTHNDTLWPNVHYIVTDNYAIVSGAELVIKPGVTLKFKDNVMLSNAGKIYAVGTPDSMITFTKTDLGTGWKGMYLNKYDTLGYAIIENISWLGHFENTGGSLPSETTNYYSSIFGNTEVSQINKNIYPLLINSIFRHNSHWPAISNISLRYSNLYDNITDYGFYPYCLFGRHCSYYGSSCALYPHFDTITMSYNNVINNRNTSSNYGGFIEISQEPEIVSELWPMSTNLFGNYVERSNHYGNGGYYDLCTNSTTPWSTSLKGLYMGTSKEYIARQHIHDFDYPNSGTFGFLDLTYMEQEPIHEAHGIVWKVEVNGYDAQDELDSIIPLGVGTHEFKVYFNRAMDTNVTPMVAMGVRPPYTQTAISENASWSADSTIYTAHVTLTGRSAIDGLNRIYVSGAQDDEHFEIPYEKQRFNVYVASSGSMSAGFQATAGIGKVELEWNDQETHFEDFLGFNLYRYQYDSLLTNRHWDSERSMYVYDTVWGPTDTIQLSSALQDTLFTDYNVVPGERYYYFYKILSTSLTENSPSNTVSCVPNSAILGDANGSMSVDVADVITTINYITGQPQAGAFLFDAADVNGDGEINVLDIVGIINIILHPNSGTQSISDPMTAIYTVENDTLYINTPTPLAGLQFTLANCTRADVEVLPALTGFECATVEDNGNLTMIFYSMGGVAVPFGKTALLRIGNIQIADIALSDPQGQNVVAMNGDLLGLVDINAVQAQFATAYPNPFSGKTRLELTVGNYSTVAVVFTDLMGKTVDTRTLETPTAGDYSLTWDASGMPRGIYFATLYADGQKAQTIKLIVK